MQRRIVWCDAEANFQNLNNQDAVEKLIKNAARCNIDTLIIDIKPLAGEVLYKSKIAPRFKGTSESIIKVSILHLAAFFINFSTAS